MGNINIKREKARNLRYKKPIVTNINLFAIQEELWQITGECEDVKYYMDTDEDSLINALEGDEDDAFEFKMMFSDLCVECEQMQNDLQDAYIPECFDDFFVAIGAREYGGGLLGYDTYEQDYFGIDAADSFVESESKKRLLRLTKEQLLDAAHICLKILYAYLGLKDRYNNLKAALDILRDKNTGHLQMVKQIESLYEEANECGFVSWHCDAVKELDKLLQNLPDEAWIS